MKLRKSLLSLCGLALLSFSLLIALLQDPSALAMEPQSDALPPIQAPSSATLLVSCPVTGQIPQLECEALEALYNSTGGPNWLTSTNWLVMTIPCSWHGVACVDNAVSSIDLASNGLIGQLPPEIGNFSNLTYLNLSFNQLQGALPIELANLQQIRELHLNDNQFTGGVPPQLGNLANLDIWLDLSVNQLTGTIPAMLGQLTGLRNLALDNNLLIGVIPAELGNMVSLETLYLGENRLSGPLPQTIGDLANLTFLDLSHNLLQGALPAEVAHLTQLRELHLNHNQFEGNIPPELGELTSLVEWLDLSVNQFSGPIPASFSELTNLRNLALDENSLDGQIPSQLGNMVSLESLYLDTNQLNGALPASLGGLANLWELTLSDNYLSGPIPKELGSLSNLRFLKLQWNQLSGSIPPELGSLDLEGLDLRGNALRGEIPTELDNLCQTIREVYWLELDYNALTTSDPGAFSCLPIKAPEWMATQTVAPTNLTATALSSQSVQLAWQPISYTVDPGYYEIRYATTPGGPYDTLAADGITKSHSSHIIEDLTPGSTYHFVMRTFTPAHEDLSENIRQKNELWSDYSAPVVVTTPLGQVQCTSTNEREAALNEIFPQRGDGTEYSFGEDIANFCYELVAEADCSHTGDYGVRLKYDMRDEDFGGWGMQWIEGPAEPFNASEYDTVEFWVKGAEGGETFQVAIVDSSTHSTEVGSENYVAVQREWSQVQIPLDDFQGINNSALLNIEFNVYANDNSGSFCIDGIAFVRTDRPRWAVMVYLNGDNDLDRWTEELFNRLELITALESDSPLQIRVLWDRLGANNTTFYDVQPDTDVRALANYVEGQTKWSRGEQDMGDPNTLSGFILEARAAMPADHYLLSVVDHGGGWSPELLDSQKSSARFRAGASGLSWDWTNDYHYLSSKDMGDVFSHPALVADPIDLFFYDVCLAGMLEEAMEIRNGVRFLVASQNETWTSFPYDQYLSGIAQRTPKEQASWMVETYVNSLIGYPRTMSVMDLQHTSSMTQAIHSLALALEEQIHTPDYQERILSAFTRTQKFDYNYDLIIEPKEGFVDIGNLAAELIEEFPDSEIADRAEQVRETLTGSLGPFIVHERHQSGRVPWHNSYVNLDQATGLSIYLPLGENDLDLYFYRNDQLDMAQTTRWDDFIFNFLEIKVALPPENEVGGRGNQPRPFVVFALYLPLVANP